MFIARIEALPFFVGGIFAVFADNQNTVNCEFLTAQGKCLRNRRISLHCRKTFQSFATEVVVFDLFNEKGDEIHRWVMVSAVPPITF